MSISKSNDETIIVTAKTIPGLSDLNVKNHLITSYSGMLFDIWNEIARANNYRYQTLHIYWTQFFIIF
jgi:hypothetical protein